MSRETANTNFIIFGLSACNIKEQEEPRLVGLVVFRIMYNVVSP
jgi:hypothetical protein